LYWKNKLLIHSRQNDLEDEDDEDEEDLETADQKRHRMARELIQKAQDYKVQKEEEDEFFLNDGVQRDEQFDTVTRALQLDHVNWFFMDFLDPYQFL